MLQMPMATWAIKQTAHFWCKNRQLYHQCVSLLSRVTLQVLSNMLILAWLIVMNGTA